MKNSMCFITVIVSFALLLSFSNISWVLFLESFFLWAEIFQVASGQFVGRAFIVYDGTMKQMPPVEFVTFKLAVQML